MSKEISEQAKSLLSRFDLNQLLHFRRCSDCAYYGKGGAWGRCTRTVPPTLLLSPFDAQICEDYTIERPIKFEVPQAVIGGSISSERLYCVKTAPQGNAQVVKTVEGWGEVDHIFFENPAQASSHKTAMVIKCDGNFSFHTQFLSLETYGHTSSTPKISLLKYAVDGLCAMLLSVKFTFQKKLEILLYNVDSPQPNCYIDGLVNLKAQ